MNRSKRSSGQSRGLQISLSPCVEAVCQNKPLCQTRPMEGFDRRYCPLSVLGGLTLLMLWTGRWRAVSSGSELQCSCWQQETQQLPWSLITSWRFCPLLVPFCPSAGDLFTVKTVSSLLAKKTFSLAATVSVVDAYSSYKLFIFYVHSPHRPQISLRSGRAKDILENLSLSVRKTKKFCFKAVILNLWVAAPLHIRYLRYTS